MKIRHRLILHFALLVTGIMVVFSLSIYAFYVKHRKTDFIERLKTRAINTAILLNTEPFDANTLKIIDHTSVTNLEDLTVIVLDSTGSFLYCNRTVDRVNLWMPMFKTLDWRTNGYKAQKDRVFVSFPYEYQQNNYILLATAIDVYGNEELKQLLVIILGVFVFSLVLIVVAGIVNTHQSLKPIRHIIHQVDEIKGGNLDVTVQTQSKDEIAELASTFNKMLGRIRQAFEREKFFVSNASHELRTPLTSMKGQIEVALIKKRDDAEYIRVLLSLLDDVENMSQIINGFLELAESNADSSNLLFQGIRADELLFAVKDDFLKRKPAYSIDIEFEKIPAKEDEILIRGNYGLLWILLTNLVDNACKFSENKAASVTIDFDDTSTIIRVSDKGIGIPADELNYITQPLYRAKNVEKTHGHGLGLSIVQRIAEIHHAPLKILSELRVGTTVIIAFPKKS